MQIGLVATNTKQINRRGWGHGYIQLTNTTKRETRVGKQTV